MRLFAEYKKERENVEVIYDDHCFLTYKREDDFLVVFDIYSDKEVRNTGYMLEFCNSFYDTMKKEGINTVYGMTDTSTNGWENSDRLLKKYGFKFMGLDPENNKIRNYYYNLGEV